MCLSGPDLLVGDFFPGMQGMGDDGNGMMVDYTATAATAMRKKHQKLSQS